MGEQGIAGRARERSRLRDRTDKRAGFQGATGPVGVLTPVPIVDPAPLGERVPGLINRPVSRIEDVHRRTLAKTLVFDGVEWVIWSRPPRRFVRTEVNAQSVGAGLTALLVDQEGMGHLHHLVLDLADTAFLITITADGVVVFQHDGDDLDTLGGLQGEAKWVKLLAFDGAGDNFQALLLPDWDFGKRLQIRVQNTDVAARNITHMTALVELHDAV